MHLDPFYGGDDACLSAWVNIRHKDYSVDYPNGRKYDKHLNKSFVYKKIKCRESKCTYEHDW